MVRLKHEFPQEVIEESVNFNSSMVRLKLAPSIHIEAAENSFQFQYGTIKAFEGSKAGKTSFKFQFQYGTIKARSAFRSTLAILSISIPVWYD